MKTPARRLFLLLLTAALLLPAGGFATPAAPERVTIEGSRYVARGRTIRLKARVWPDTAEQQVIWTSDNPAVATVSRKGAVTGVKTGKTWIRAASAADGSVQAAFRIVVKTKAVTKIYVTSPMKTLNMAETPTLQLGSKVYPGAAAQDITWKSSKTSVATVSESGLLWAKKPGTVTVTASARDGSGVVGEITIRIIREEPGRCYALLIGEKTFLATDGFDYCLDIARRNTADALHMEAMLKKVRGPNGSAFRVTRKTDLTYEGIRSAIRTAFGGATERDVCLFFIATHGNSDGDGELLMPFKGSIPEDIGSYMAGHPTLSFRTLAWWLKGVKGRVIVILESCGAGSAVYKKTVKENGFSPAAFAAGAAGAFRAEDPGAQAVSDTGEMRVINKFYVLAAARHREESWGYEDENPRNLFTEWLIRGVGRKGASPADANSDATVDLDELFRYIKRAEEQHPAERDGEPLYQHVQRYPADKGYPLFRLN